jgi:hypothetical protein
LHYVYVAPTGERFHNKGAAFLAAGREAPATKPPDPKPPKTALDPKLPEPAPPFHVMGAINCVQLSPPSPDIDDPPAAPPPVAEPPPVPDRPPPVPDRPPPVLRSLAQMFNHGRLGGSGYLSK